MVGPDDELIGELELRVEALTVVAAALLAVLRAIEWSGDDMIFQCPLCRRWKMQGHETDCALAAHLKGA